MYYCTNCKQWFIEPETTIPTTFNDGSSPYNIDYRSGYYPATCPHCGSTEAWTEAWEFYTVPYLDDEEFDDYEDAVKACGGLNVSIYHVIEERRTEREIFVEEV